MLFAPSGKGRKRQKKGEKGRFWPISRKGGQTPLKPPFVTPPFAASQVWVQFRESSSQPRDWKSSWRDFSEVRGGFGREFPEGGPDFLEVALVWEFPYGILPKQTSKKFASEPPKLLRSPSGSGSMQKLVLALSYQFLAPIKSQEKGV